MPWKDADTSDEDFSDLLLLFFLINMFLRIGLTILKWLARWENQSENIGDYSTAVLTCKDTC